MQLLSSSRQLTTSISTITMIAVLTIISGCGGGGDNGGEDRCSDYKYQEDAQSALQNGQKQLDADNDGIACENLPHR